VGTFEQAHQRELLAAHRARLNVLELQQAREGYGIDPAVVTEISQIQTAIARLSDALDQPIPEKTLKALSPDDRYQGHVAWQMRMEEAIYEFRRDMRDMRRMLLVFGAVLLIVATAVALRAGT
jgi:hypothetical protein